MSEGHSDNKKPEVDERLSALLSNASAIRAVAAAVEGTIGPKGLNCMLVDRFGDVTITNDGLAILEKIDLGHPAARILINTAKAQGRQVGDGTTTATIIASALVTEAVNQVGRGVPVIKIIEGMRAGLERAAQVMQARSRPIEDLDDPLLAQAALIAARGERQIAALAVKAVNMVGKGMLAEPSFRLSDWIVACEGADNEVFAGLVVEKQRMNRQMPRHVRRARVLLVDDALEPEGLEDEALATESGFARYLELKGRFAEAIKQVIALGVNVVVVERGVSDDAEEALTEAGALALRRVSARDLGRIADLTGARPLKRGGLARPPHEIKRCLGLARLVAEDERLGHVRFERAGRRAATVLVGAATAEVKEERHRIAEDAVSAAQQAVLGGVVPGGGATEMAASLEVQHLRDTMRGMAAYGAECVIEALRRPLAQILTNAGFNPLEKMGDLMAEMSGDDRGSLAVDCDTGQVADMLTLGVVDPTPVKLHALRAAGEVAEAVLRINTIIRKRDPGPAPGAA